MLSKLKTKIANLVKLLKSISSEQTYKPIYRIYEISQADEQYIITIQVINKSVTFNMKPEEILADDKLVDLFSPRDIRTLTYLGYLGINSPQYKILAKRLSTDNDNLIFALKKKGDKSVIIKTANEILKENNILDSLSAKDAQLIGYTFASESITSEEKAKAIARSQSKKTSNDD